MTNADIISRDEVLLENEKVVDVAENVVDNPPVMKMAYNGGVVDGNVEKRTSSCTSSENISSKCSVGSVSTTSDSDFSEVAKGRPESIEVESTRSAVLRNASLEVKHDRSDFRIGSYHEEK
jgi:hypothetical protein